MLKSQIFIVTSNNEKMNIDIHEGMLKANTKKNYGEEFDMISNKFDPSIRKKYSEAIKFITDYKSGYAPIRLQSQNEANEQIGDNTRSHFIRKKQSTLSLPRSCGVSYIKESESVQRNPFNPLPPLVFQVSSNCQYNNQENTLFKNKIEEFVRKCEEEWIPFIETTEDEMKNLLLGKPSGKVQWVHGIINLWPLFTEGTFILLLFSIIPLETEKDVWNALKRCVFKIGILAKKSTSGKKSFLKSIKTGDSEINFDEEEKIDKEQNEKKEENYEKYVSFNINSNDEFHVHQKKLEIDNENSKNTGLIKSEEEMECEKLFETLCKELENINKVVTLSLKLEMYVEKESWEKSDLEIKNLLYGTIVTLKERLEKKSLEIICHRLKLSKEENKINMLNEVFKKIVRSEFFSCSFDEFIKNEENNEAISLEKFEKVIKVLSITKKRETNEIKIKELFKNVQCQNMWEKYLKMPIYYISTRDSFAFDLIEKTEILKRDYHFYKKINYYFEPNNIPSNYTDYKKLFPDLHVGVTCYHDFFTKEELTEFEENIFKTEQDAFKNKYLPMTVQPYIVGTHIKRTKFFFGYRYMWTRCQLAEPLSYVGAGVRKDVTPPPSWIKQVELPLVNHNIVEKGFINSVALNVYHDGKEGLAQHFDDAVRFKQPIYTIRLVSDGRLSFGSQFYGFCNGAFIIPLPRGCICVMNESSYAANGVKHCIRPCDMTGKSAAVILRQMHETVVNEAERYDELIDFPNWLSTMSIKTNAVSFVEQKKREAEALMGPL